MEYFKDALRQKEGYDYPPSEYLKAARANAKRYGLDPQLLTFSKDYPAKLSYNGVDFGHADYWDYLILKRYEKKGRIEEGNADDKRRQYLARATNIKGIWRNDKISPNNLAINILWQ